MYVVRKTEKIEDKKIDKKHQISRKPENNRTNLNGILTFLNTHFGRTFRVAKINQDMFSNYKSTT